MSTSFVTSKRIDYKLSILQKDLDHVIDTLSEARPIAISPNIFVEAFPEQNNVTARVFVERQHAIYNMSQDFPFKNYTKSEKANLKNCIRKMLFGMSGVL